MMRKKYWLCLLAVLCLSGSAMADSFLRSPRDAGGFVRVGGGVPLNFNVGLGYRFSPIFAMGAEVKTLSEMCGVAGVVDARFYLSEKWFAPFVDVNAGYGLLGKDYENANCCGYVLGAMLGVSWRRIDLGIGATYDPFNQVCPMVNISYNFRWR